MTKPTTTKMITDPNFLRLLINQYINIMVSRTSRSELVTGKRFEFIMFMLADFFENVPVRIIEYFMINSLFIFSSDTEWNAFFDLIHNGSDIIFYIVVREIRLNGFISTSNILSDT